MNLVYVSVYYNVYTFDGPKVSPEPAEPKNDPKVSPKQ